VSVAPSFAVPVIVGTGVAVNCNNGTVTAVEVAAASVKPAFDPVTRTASVLPASATWTVYTAEVAAEMAAPSRSHW